VLLFNICLFFNGSAAILPSSESSYIRGGWSHYNDTSEPQNMVTVQSEFRTSDLSITGPTRLPNALTGPTKEVVKGVYGWDVGFRRKKVLFILMRLNLTIPIIIIKRQKETNKINIHFLFNVHRKIIIMMVRLKLTRRWRATSTKRDLTRKLKSPHR
jgi:hypothetical protein